MLGEAAVSYALKRHVKELLDALRLTTNKAELNAVLEEVKKEIWSGIEIEFLRRQQYLESRGFATEVELLEDIESRKRDFVRMLAGSSPEMYAELDHERLRLLAAAMVAHVMPGKGEGDDAEIWRCVRHLDPASVYQLAQLMLDEEPEFFDSVGVELDGRVTGTVDDEGYDRDLDSGVQPALAQLQAFGCVIRTMSSRETDSSGFARRRAERKLKKAIEQASSFGGGADVESVSVPVPLYEQIEEHSVTQRGRSVLTKLAAFLAADDGLESESPVDSTPET